MVLTNEQMAIYLHVDDGLVMCASGPPEQQKSPHESQADVWMNVFADSLEGIGFKVGDRTPHDKLAKIVGYAPQRSPAQLRLSKCCKKSSC